MVYSQASAIPKEKKDGNQLNTFEDGWNAARDRLKENGIRLVESDVEIKVIIGKIKEISSTEIAIKVPLFSILDEPSLKDRVIKIDADTQFFKQTGQKNTTETQPTGVVPENIIKEKIDATLLTTNQYILVLTDKNIRQEKVFSGKEVILITDMPKDFLK